MAKIPEFKTIEEEREFWATHELTDYLDDVEVVEGVEFVIVKPWIPIEKPEETHMPAQRKKRVSSKQPVQTKIE